MPYGLKIIDAKNPIPLQDLNISINIPIIINDFCLSLPHWLVWEYIIKIKALYIKASQEIKK